TDLSGTLSEPINFGRNLANRDGHCGVPVITVVDDSKIQTDDVPALEDSLRRRNTMNHLLINRNAQTRRKPSIPFECWLRLLLESQFFGDFVHIRSCGAVAND